MYNISIFKSRVGSLCADWIVFVCGILICAFCLKITFRIFLNRFESFTQRTHTEINHYLLKILKGTKSFAFFIIPMFCMPLIINVPTHSGSATAIKLIHFIAKILSFIQISIWLDIAVRVIFNAKVAKLSAQNPSSRATLDILSLFARILLFCLTFLVGLDALGVNVTALITSLGVGGIAIALAVQRILGDVFASISILLDRPFELGDSIEVGDHKGTIEKIGIKTTRIRSFSGEQLILPNSDLIHSRVRNFKRMRERRVEFSVGVVYRTSASILRKIPEMIQSIVEREEKVRFERSHFVRFGGSALEFDTIYWILQADYQLYADIHQRITLALYEAFAAKGIEFAYPTQTIYLKPDSQIEGSLGCNVLVKQESVLEKS